MRTILGNRCFLRSQRHPRIVARYKRNVCPHWKQDRLNPKQLCPFFARCLDYTYKMTTFPGEEHQNMIINHVDLEEKNINKLNMFLQQEVLFSCYTLLYNIAKGSNFSRGY